MGFICGSFISRQQSSWVRGTPQVGDDCYILTDGFYLWFLHLEATIKLGARHTADARAVRKWASDCARIRGVYRKRAQHTLSGTENRSQPPDAPKPLGLELGPRTPQVHTSAVKDVYREVFIQFMSLIR
jgi:hypothetical protein